MAARNGQPAVTRLLEAADCEPGVHAAAQIPPTVAQKSGAVGHAVKAARTMLQLMSSFKALLKPLSSGRRRQDAATPPPLTDETMGDASFTD